MNGGAGKEREAWGGREGWAGLGRERNADTWGGGGPAPGASERGGVGVQPHHGGVALRAMPGGVMTARQRGTRRV